MATTYSSITANKRKSVALVVIFVVFVLFLGWAFGQWTQSGYGGVIIAAVIALAMSLFGYYGGASVALATAGARRVETKKGNPYLWRLVENLTITAGLPMPKVYVIEDPALNAFACGRNPEHASIAVTSGLIAGLENEELEGVIAHELSHVKNYDIRLMTLVIVLVGMIALLSNWLVRFHLFGGRRSSNNSSGNIGLILMLVGFVLLILSPLIAKLIQLAISRKREFLADADSALLTRYPEGLARALEKIARSPERLRHATNATAHLYIANPFSHKPSRLTSLFSTHPPVEARITALHQMASAAPHTSIDQPTKT